MAANPTADTRGTALTVRPATEADLPALVEFAERVFRESFGRDNTPENMDAYIGGALTVGRFAAILRDAGARTLVGEAGGGIAAYAQLMTAPPPAEHLDGERDGSGCALLQRFYLDPALHGSGAANVLLAAVLDAAADLGAATLWLTVWERNPRAIRYYEKQGFEAIGNAPFQLGDERQNDLVMQRDVRPGFVPRTSPQ